MEKVRLGFVGVGIMGSFHLTNAVKMSDVTVACVCDIDAERARQKGEQYHCPFFTDYHDMIKKENLDAVVIATPHYFHPPIAIHAFEQGVHVLCEKPMAVQVKDAQAMIEAHKNRPELKFALMFQLRLMPIWQQVKKMIDRNDLEKIFRISWINTLWYRSQAYYNSGGWRGSWKGEGGGILMNQCPHYLDLYTWFFGLPKRVIAICKFGRYHDIEVEDDVSAFFEYDDGKTASFITTTGEFPGSNRLEIACDRGRVIVEDDKLHFDRTTPSVSDFTTTNKDMWGTPELWRGEVPVAGENPGHKAVLENFVQSILGRAELIAKGEEGFAPLMLANAIVYAGHTGEAVDLPLDAKAYEKLLKQFVAHSEG